MMHTPHAGVTWHITSGYINMVLIENEETFAVSLGKKGSIVWTL
jgi:hypothetical protein